jgi:hypothetical protein
MLAQFAAATRHTPCCVAAEQDVVDTRRVLQLTELTQLQSTRPTAMKGTPNYQTHTLAVPKL